MLGLSYGVWALHCSARAPLHRMPSLEHAGSVVVVVSLGPRPRIKPTSPALEGEFLTIGPPGMSPPFISLKIIEKLKEFYLCDLMSTQIKMVKC